MSAADGTRALVYLSLEELPSRVPWESTRNEPTSPRSRVMDSSLANISPSWMLPWLSRSERSSWMPSEISTASIRMRSNCSCTYWREMLTEPSSAVRTLDENQAPMPTFRVTVANTATSM